MAMTVEGMVQKEEFLERSAVAYPELRRTALPKWDHTANARRSSTDSIIGLPLYTLHGQHHIMRFQTQWHDSLQYLFYVFYWYVFQ
jgi:hypothetical protein